MRSATKVSIAVALVVLTIDAIRSYEQALRVKPDYAEAANNLGLALATSNRLPEAIEQFREAVRLDAGLAQARANLAKLEEARH